MMLGLIVDADNLSLSATYLLFFPILYIIAMLIVRFRFSLVEAMRPNELDSAVLHILHSRALIAKWRNSQQNFEEYMEETPHVNQTRQEMSDLVEKVLQTGVRRFPDYDLLRIFFAVYYTVVVDNRVLAYGELQVVETQNPSFMDLYSISVYRNRLDKLRALQQSKEVQSYLEFKSRKEIADSSVATASKLLVQFWTELLKTAPDIDDLSALGHEALGLIIRSNQNYTILLNINPNSVPVLRTYGSVLLDLLGDVAKSSELFSIANQLEKARELALKETIQQGDFLQRLDTNLDIFDDKNSVFGISIDRSELGLIESVNVAAKRLFGYSSDADIVGKNIRSIVPSPLSENHDRFLLDYLGRKTSRIVNQTRMAFAVHRRGHLLPVNLYVRWADEANAKIVGVIQTIPQEFTDVNIMVDLQTLALTYTTPNCYSIFGISRKRIAGKEIKVHDIIPSLLDKEDPDAMEKRWNIMSSRMGLECDGRHLLTGQPIRLKAWCLTQNVFEVSVMFIRMVIMYTDDHHLAMGGRVANDVTYEEAPTHGRAETVFGDHDAMQQRSVQDQYELAEHPNPNNYDKTDNDDKQNRMRSHGHRRLKKAISNENLRTFKRLETMKIFSVILVLSVIAVSVALHLLSNFYINRIGDQLHMVSYSSRRELLAEDVSVHFRSSTLVADSTVGVMTRNMMTVTSTEDVRKYYLTRTFDSVESLRKLSMDVDSGSATKEQGYLRTEPVLDAEVLIGDVVSVDAVSLKELSTAFSSMTHVAIDIDPALNPTSHRILNGDSSAFFVIANGEGVMKVGSKQNTEYVRDQIDQSHDHLLIISCCLFIFLLLEMLAILLVFVRPIVLRVEDAKTHVLDMFMDIPRNLRKALRRKVHGVYLLMKHDGEDDKTRVEIDDDDEGDGDQVDDNKFDGKLYLANLEAHRNVQMLRMGGGASERPVNNQHNDGLDNREDHGNWADSRAGYRGPDGSHQPDKLIGRMGGMGGMGSPSAATGHVRILADDPSSDEDTVANRRGNRPDGEAVNLTAISSNTLRSLNKDEVEMSRLGPNTLSIPDIGDDAEMEMNSDKMKSREARRLQRSEERHQNNKLAAASERSLLARRALRNLVLKYVFYFVYIAAYFIALIVLTNAATNKLIGAGVTVDFATQRQPALQRAFSSLREHLFFDYNAKLAAEPNLPTLRGGPFLDRATTYIERSALLQHSVLFGNAQLNLEIPAMSDAQSRFLFDSACTIDPNSNLYTTFQAAAFIQPIPGWYGTNCDTYLNGILKHGLLSAYIYAEDTLRAMATSRTAFVFAPEFGGPPNPNIAQGSPEYVQLSTMFAEIDALINEYLPIALQHSNLLYIHDAIESLGEINNIRLGLLLGFILLLCVMHILVFHPIVNDLNSTSRQTRDTMLILPPDVVKSIASVQAFIVENYRSSD